MELKNSKILFTLSMLWAVALLALGTWWGYLIISLGDYAPEKKNFTSMIKWEGGFFLILLLLLSFSLLILYLKDQKRNRALAAFFSSLTHELKTPLASIRLQGEVIHDLIHGQEQGASTQQLHNLHNLSERLIEDTARLEIQMDKILQLSRMEQGGNLNPVNLDLGIFLNSVAKTWAQDLGLTLHGKVQAPVSADEFALELILKNLFENTRNHAGSKNVSINITEREETTILEYRDGGKFTGDPKKMATLFYKHESNRGSGIGLYLVGRLMQRMGGSLTITFSPELVFTLEFCRPITLPRTFDSSVQESPA